MFRGAGPSCGLFFACGYNESYQRFPVFRFSNRGPNQGFAVPRAIMAFNGDLEARLALHWLVHERGYEVITLSINLGQEVFLEPLGEIALELGATAAQVIDRRLVFLSDFCFPALQAGAVYQQSCFLGSALARFLIAQELVRVARDEGCETVAHAAASKGNDQVRMETAIASQDPKLAVIAPVRQWNLKNRADKLKYARKRNLPIEEPTESPLAVDRNLWGVSVFFPELTDSWQEAPADAFVLTKPVEQTPNEAAVVTLGFEAGIPCSLNGERLGPLPLVRELNRLGGIHSIGRNDVVEDRMFGIKSREIYEVPAPTILWTAHRDLESLVHSKEMVQLREPLSRRYAELVYMGLWFQDARRALQEFVRETQKLVTGEVRLKLYKGACTVLGRRSPYSLYDGRLANQTNLEFFDNHWAQGFTSVWSLQTRLAARQQTQNPENHP
jgi:argininosuccinate synthase